MSAQGKTVPTLDDARLVVRYKGAQIFDAREFLLITFDAPPKRGISGQLHNGNWHRSRDGVWSKRSTPTTIFAVQAILKDAYGAQL